MKPARQGWFGNLRLRPWMLKMGFAFYPPLRGASIRLRQISADFRHARVDMSLGISNRNMWGVHFGGSLFSMTDSIYAIMVKQNLGPDYVVWDKSATIDFRKPGLGTVHCDFKLDDSTIEHIRQATRGGEKYIHVIDVQVVNENDEIVADVSKTLHIRKQAMIR